MTVPPKKRQEFHDLLRVRYSKCLEPNECCNEEAIRSHSIQNATSQQILAKNGHVIAPRPLLGGGRAPEIEFKRIGRNQASTFEGLCARHDNDIFEPIEAAPLDVQDPQHLFLLAYRSVLKEVHAAWSSAMMLQGVFQNLAESDPSLRERPNDAGMHAVSQIINAYKCYLYKRKVDQAFLEQQHDRISHASFAYGDVGPSVAVSSLSSLDEYDLPDDVPRVALNVFPLSGQTHAIFSYLKEEESCAMKFLKPIIDAKPFDQRVLISRFILERTGNFVMSPDYFDAMSNEKKRAIKSFFVRTIFSNAPDLTSPHLYLF